ncbi:hypothetical protein EW145_g88 [Phellinidium pouzarii]|uniref:Uncharacterized protein n=1 Tax=Phellinidium pouzarii TaxID=167371 RepID=A0A4S4LLN8_9AGAM|nr:hypothetical protein EW145_g88 [Phellinidium pouzarii]
MDSAQPVEMTREQEMISTRKRTNGRPHSRNGSVVSISLSTSNSTNSVLSMASEPSPSSSGSRPSSLASNRSRPTSHHRRRSSVSTRVESAEMMGVALPDFPSSSSDDNVNLGDRDSIRRRALFALEGKNEFSSGINTVEIPELNESFSQKSLEPKLPMTLPAFGLSSSLSGKRDSFGKFATSGSSLKDQLHTLLEEEEEEEEEEEGHNIPVSRLDAATTSNDVSVACGQPRRGDRDTYVQTSNSRALKPQGSPLDLSSIAPSSVPPRHKPANLTLRPLSLTPNTSVNLPTPSLTPNSQPVSRAFSFTCASDVNNPAESADEDTLNQDQRHWSHVRSESPASTSSESRRQSSMGCISSSSMSPSLKRQSSISYIRSGSTQALLATLTTTGLPTPGATPTSERRQSTSSTSSFGSIPGQDRRNASEEMFLHQSHASLLARIAELERALQASPRSRPNSSHSDEDTKYPEPYDEMFQLVADLKSERDELNRVIDGWRQRVNELEREKSILERRLDAEKRDSWLKGEKLGLLEVEKDTLGQDEAAKRQLAEAQSLLDAKKGIESELQKVREAFSAEQAYREQLVRELDAAGLLKTPRMSGSESKGMAVSYERMIFNIQARSNGLGFRSIDSTCTTVDPEDEGQQAIKGPFTLKAVEEELEMPFNEEEDELARYEDDDLGIISPTHSMTTFSSDEDLPSSVSHLRLAVNGTPVPSGGDVPLTSRSLSSSPSPFSSPCPTPVPPLSPEVRSVQHANRASLSKTWTFPVGEKTPSRRSLEQVDRFFECLEDIDDSPPLDSQSTMDNRSLFSQRLQFEDSEDDEMPPFVLPAQKGANQQGVLDTVLEEDEDKPHGKALNDEKIRSAFPVSVSEESLGWASPPLSECSVPFVFPQMKIKESTMKSIEVSTPRPSNTLYSSNFGNSVSTPNSKSMAHLNPPRLSERARPIGTPIGRASNSIGTRVLSPSRIPPPSPMFLQAKTAKTRTAPSPPRRKPAPSTSPSPVSSPVTTATGKVAGPLRNIGKPAPTLHPSNGSTFLPRLKSPSTQTHLISLNVTDTDYLSSSSRSTSRTSTIDKASVRMPIRINNRVADSSLPATLPSQPLFQTFTNLFPITTFFVDSQPTTTLLQTGPDNDFCFKRKATCKA